MDQTTSKKALGIDPGLTTTLAVITLKTVGTYHLLERKSLKTAANDEGARLLEIYQHITELLQVHAPNVVAIYRVFHNDIDSDALTAAAVTGVIELAAEQGGIPCEMFTPEQVKAATVGSRQADKKDTLTITRYISRLLGGQDIRNHHEVTAAAAAITGLLQIQA